MFTNTIQRISGFLNLFFPKKKRFTIALPRKAKSKYALYTYASVKRDILNLKSGVFSQATDSFVRYVLTISPVPNAALIYVPSTTHALGIKQIDHMRNLVLAHESTLSSVYTVCINALYIQNKKVQHTLNRKDRFMYTKNKFSISPAFKEYIQRYRITHIVCIDDVTTTGATRLAVENLFKECNVKLLFVAIASQD